MGTGPYILVSREPDVKSVFKKNPNWWGLKEQGYFDGNVDEIVYTPIKNDGTRMAALLSGELDFVLDPPVQDIDKLKQDKNIKVYEGRENRIIFLGMDQARDELLYSNVKGKNPFKDKRVRQAFYQAIDVNAINKAVMRGLSVPTGDQPAQPRQAPASRSRWTSAIPYDVAAREEAARRGGLPERLRGARSTARTTATSTTRRSASRWPACSSKIGVTVKVNAIPRAQYFPKAQKLDISFYMLGWGGATTDAIFTLQPVLHSRNDKGDGDYNWGNYKDAEVRRADRRRQGRHRPEAPPGDDQQGDAVLPRQRAHDPAAPAGDPVGLARQRRA